MDPIPVNKMNELQRNTAMAEDKLRDMYSKNKDKEMTI